MGIKKALINFLILYYSGNLFSQNSFFIRPIIDNSIGISTVWKGLNPINAQVVPLNNSDYFTFEPMKFVFPHKFSPMNIGLNVGYTFNKKRTSFETGINQYGTSCGYKLKYKSYFYDGYINQKFVYVDRILSESSGILGLKIPLLLTTQLFKKDSLNIWYKKRPISIRFNIQVGLNYFVQPTGNRQVPVWSSGADSLQVDKNVYLSYTSKMFSGERSSILYQFGFSTDIEYKGKELFNFSFFYLKARRYKNGNRILSNYTIDISTTNVPNTIYHYEVDSDGGAIMFQLSRRFNFLNRR